MSSFTQVPLVEKKSASQPQAMGDSIASRGVNDGKTGHGAPVVAEILAVVHSSIKRERPVNNSNAHGYASDPQVRPIQRIKLSSTSVMDSEDETIPVENAKPLESDCFQTILTFLPLKHLVILRTLSKGTKAMIDKICEKRDCFNAILTFLPVEHLVTLRSLSKDTKVTIDKMVEKRAQRYESLGLKIGGGDHFYNKKQVRKHIWIEPLTREAFLDRNRAINFALGEHFGKLVDNFGAGEVDLARSLLLQSGRAFKSDTVNGVFVQYLRKVSLNDTLEVSIALRAITRYFRQVEIFNYSFDSNNAFGMYTEEEKVELVAKMNKDGQKIVLAKDTIISLLLMDARNTVRYIRLVSADLRSENGERRMMSDEHWNKEGRTLLVFRLSNGLEIALDSCYYQNWATWILGSIPVRQN